MTTADKIQALNNALKNYGYREGLFIHSVGKNLFMIAELNSIGGINTHSIAYNYNDMNLFIKVYNQGFNNDRFKLI